MNDALRFFEIASWSVTSCAAFSFARSQLLITLSEKNCDKVAVLFVNFVSKVAMSFFSSCFDMGCGVLIVIFIVLLLFLFVLYHLGNRHLFCEILKRNLRSEERRVGKECRSRWS